MTTLFDPAMACLSLSVTKVAAAARASAAEANSADVRLSIPLRNVLAAIELKAYAPLRRIPSAKSIAYHFTQPVHDEAKDQRR